MNSVVPESIEEAPIEIQGHFPGLWWNEDREQARFDRVDEIEDQLSSADVVGIVDSDADGKACAAVLRSKYDNPVVIEANGSEYGISFTHAVNIVADNVTDTPVIVADLSPDSTFSSFLASVAKVDSETRIYDHHDWNWTAKTSVENVVDELVVDDEMCAAQVLQQSIYPEADEQLREFLEVTADHDLWIKEDDRSDHLSTLAFELPRSEYIRNALEYGADMIERSDELESVYTESEQESDRMAEEAINQAEYLTINGVDVAITYFGCHQSRVGDQLIEEEGVDLAVIIQPTGSISFRSTGEFSRCADLARGLGGGGHNDAAGANIYNNINFNPDTVDPEDVYVPEIDEGVESVDVNSLTRLEYLWRTQGTPALEFMREYVEAEV